MLSGLAARQRLIWVRSLLRKMKAASARPANPKIWIAGVVMAAAIPQDLEAARSSVATEVQVRLDTSSLSCLTSALTFVEFRYLQ